jgi:hypothetical protein
MTKYYDLKNALFQAKRILEMRPGTADSDINALTIPQAVPWWVLDDLFKAAEITFNREL